MKKKVTYKEPAAYFNSDMKKAARDYEKKKKQESTQKKDKK